jgi:pilus assembly protein CpaE
MPTVAPTYIEPAVVPEVIFCSPDRAMAQRLTAKLQSIGKVRWETDASSLWTESQTGPVLLDFSAAQASASALLVRELVRLQPRLPLVAVGSGSAGQASGVLAALRAGVHDFIDLDAPADEARAILRQARENRAVNASAPVPAIRERARVVALLGVRAGVGTSTLAAHLAVLAQRGLARAPSATGQADRALLLDLGHPWGDGQLYLDVRGDFHFADALHHLARLDDMLTRTAFPRHASELAVLSHSPADDGDMPDEGDGSLLERLCGLFELILVDVGGRIGHGALPMPLRRADDIWLVADQSVGAAVSLDLALRQLDRAGIARASISLVIDRHDDSSALAPAEFAARFDLPLIAVLPERTHALRTSAALGKLLHDTSPRDRYVRALAPLIARLLRDPASIATETRHPLLARLIAVLGGR